MNTDRQSLVSGKAAIDLCPNDHEVDASRWKMKAIIVGARLSSRRELRAHDDLHGKITGYCRVHPNA